ncbi:uncharacterized protein [Pyrus communis]|uniref:uncharacterized protein n=1 Tax=Pyrus communis TaxID=23211 RepID=UPI0035C04B24
MGALCDPSEAELDFLQQRLLFKEHFRTNHMKESGSANDCPNDKNTSDNFGTFFGPSQPTISRRVLEERKVLMPGLTNLASKVRNSDDQGKKSLKSPSSTTTRSGSTMKNIKVSRDYSFLLSKEAEPPATSKGESGLGKDSILNSSNARTPVSGTNRAPLAKMKPEKKQPLDDKERHHEKRRYLMPKQSSLQRKVPKVNETSSTKSLSKKQLEQRKDLHQPTNLKPKPDKTRSPPQQENSTKSLPASKKQLEQRKVLHQPAKAKLKPDDKTQSPSQRQNLDRRKRKHIREEYSDSDNDDAAMVSTFDDIIREENRSSKIARKEDEIERLRLEEEEKQERLRKPKKQKLKAYKSDSNS